MSMQNSIEQVSRARLAIGAHGLLSAAAAQPN
jgi:hypothetical protein